MTSEGKEVSELNFENTLFDELSVSGATRSILLTITNTGQVDLILDLVLTTITGDDPSSFEESGFTFLGSNFLDLCREVLPPGESCTFHVNFHPTKLGEQSAVFNVHSNAGDKQINLTGVGVQPGTTIITHGYQLYPGDNTGEIPV